MPKCRPFQKLRETRERTLVKIKKSTGKRLSVLGIKVVPRAVYRFSESLL